MKGTVFAVALNHQSQRVAWAEAFEKAPYNAPPKTAVWFIKPHNTVIRAGEPIPFPQGETVLSGATVALVVGIFVKNNLDIFFVRHNLLLFFVCAGMLLGLLEGEKARPVGEEQGS